MSQVIIQRTTQDADIPNGSRPEQRESEQQAHTRAQIIEILAQRRQEDLDDLFHIDPSFPDQDPQTAAQLKEQFLAAKEGLNLGECFELSLQDPYFGKVHVVRLASTDHLEPDASQRMFREMNEFLHWFRTQGPMAEYTAADTSEFVSDVIGDDTARDALENGDDPGDHVDRMKSGRWMEYEFFNEKLEDSSVQEVAVINRIRPFASIEAEVRGEPCSIKLFKETVFTIDASLLRELLLFAPKVTGKDEHLYPEALNPLTSIDEREREDYKNQAMDPPITFQAMRLIEGWLYTTAGDEPKIQRHRIHTAIFSAVVPHAIDQSIMDSHDS